MSARGVAIEGVPEAAGGRVRPVALAIDGAATLARARGLDAAEILRALMAGSDTGGDLVCTRVDYLAALLALGANDATARALWRGEKATIGPYTVDLVPALCLWVSDGQRTIRVNDIQRWLPPDAGEAAGVFTPASPASPSPRRWGWDAADYDRAVGWAEAQAARAGALARAVDAALGRAGLPRYWRDGTGRVAGALLDRMATRADIARAPGVLDYAIHTAYVGGRVSVFQAGRYHAITQIDVRSAYPWAMTQLPSLDGATWVRMRWYDRHEPYGLWRVAWAVPHGAVSGPFPVRLPDNAIGYPLNGDGWYWADEVRAALACYGPAFIRPSDGYAIRPATDRRPFADLAGHYVRRRQLKADGDAAAAHVAKLALTSCYGRLAQAVQHNGKPGRWGNLALAGMTTAAVRARMMETLWEHETTAIALATDSLTIDGAADIPGSAELGGWAVTTGTDALMLPSGVFRVRGGEAAMDRVAGVERTRALLIDWDDLYAGWDVLGLALRYRARVPVFVGLGTAGASEQWPRFGTWGVQPHELVGVPRGAKPVRTAPRVWRLLPTRTEHLRSGKYVPRAGGLGRTLDQPGGQATPDAAREHDQPYA